MKAYTLKITAIALLIMLCESHAHAQDTAMAYNWRAPGAYFGEPVPISDRDESSTSQSSFRVAYTAEPETDIRSRDILAATYTVAPNPALGYAYAGFAIPFNTPMALVEDASFQVDARSPDGIERLELIVRDTSRRRATSVVTLAPSTDWTTIAVPSAKFAAIDKESIESAAVVVLSPGSGTVEISNMRLPVRALVTELSILEEIRTAPKWYPNAEMGVLVAQRLERPVLVRVDHSALAGRKRLDNPEWRAVLDQTVNVLLMAETIDTLPNGFEMMSGRSQDPLLFLFEPDGTLLKDSTASDGDAKEMAAALAERVKGKEQ